jgi:hypothetical protein
MPPNVRHDHLALKDAVGNPSATSFSFGTQRSNWVEYRRGASRVAVAAASFFKMYSFKEYIFDKGL